MGPATYNISSDHLQRAGILYQRIHSKVSYMPKDYSKLSDETFELPVAGQTLKEPERVIDTYKFYLCVTPSWRQHVY